VVTQPAISAFKPKQIKNLYTFYYKGFCQVMIVDDEMKFFRDGLVISVGSITIKYKSPCGLEERIAARFP